MAKGVARRVAFLSSFVPRKCGIATFTSDLINSLSLAAKGQFEPLVVAMLSDDNLKYNNPVKFEIRQNVKSDYVCAPDYVNFSYVDVVSVQHEFGIFGGEAGSYLSLLLSRLNAPIITTLHTVLNKPSPQYYKSLTDVCEASYKVIVMNKRGVDMLQDIYAVPRRKIELIAHGIPDLPFVDSNYYKHKFGIEGRKIILTFGLLSRNKGIEVMLKAMPEIIKAEPSVLYIVLGMTHPVVLKEEGESYRFSLGRLVKELGLQEHVVFHNRFVNEEELHNFLCAADIYVTPYHNREQLTSGTLSFAVGTGKAVVSTPYWAAMELLADGRGKLVEFDDSTQMAQTIIGILRNDSMFYSLRRRAYDYGRSRTWPRIGQVYWKLFTAKDIPLRSATRTAISAAERVSSFELPEPSLVHLERLTDDTGLYQHAQFVVPRREDGYTTDDNARALIVTAKYCAQHPDPQALTLFDRYLSFLIHSQNKDGSIRNFMNFDRTWRSNEPANDAFGRVLWALGTAIAEPPAPSYLSILKDCFDNCVRHIEKQELRGMAYSILGMSDYLKQFSGASDIKRHLRVTTDRLVSHYDKNAHPDWQWFEHKLTYDNAVLPHSLFVAGLTLEDARCIGIAEKAAGFLLSQTFSGAHFSFVGCDGWFNRGGAKAAFDQQPIEAAGTVMMLRAAYDATQNPKYLALQRKAFGWFLGENDLHTPLYDFKTRGCCDGLTPGGVNANQGAESTVSFLLGLLCVLESYAIADKIKLAAEIALEPKVKPQDSRPMVIETIPAETDSEKNQVEEPA